VYNIGFIEVNEFVMEIKSKEIKRNVSDNLWGHLHVTYEV